MVEKSLHVGLDIGTSSIKVIVSEYAKNQLNVIGVGVERSLGVNRGVIVDIDATAESIKKAVKKAEQRANVTIKKVVVGVPSVQIAIEACHGMIAVSSENREITEKDVDNVISAAKVKSVPPEREIISILPEEFVVDGFDGIKDPRGMIGVRLELFAHLVTGPKTIIHNIRKSVEKAGLQIQELVIQPLATAQTALTSGERSFGTVLVDIGGGQTTTAVLHDEQVKFVYIDQEGGEYITKDISAVLNVTMENAETIKRDYGYVYDKHSDDVSYFLTEVVGQKDLVRIDETYLSEIIEARVTQIFENVKRALDSVDALSLPGGVVLTGGASILPGMVELAESIFGVNVRLYVPEHMGMRHPSFSQVLGLLKYTINLDDIHHMAQFEAKVASSTNRVANKSNHVVKEKRMTEQVVGKPTPHVHEDMSENESKPKTSLLKRLSHNVKGFFDSLGEE